MPRTEPNAIENLVVKILTIAEMKDETDKGAIVYMPDEEEWGEIVGLARQASKNLLDEMEKLLQNL